MDTSYIMPLLHEPETGSDLNNTLHMHGPGPFLPPSLNLTTAPDDVMDKYLTSPAPGGDISADEGAMAFFAEYFSVSRFTVETVAMVTSTAFNMAAFMLIPHTRQQPYGQSVYHLLFLNLALANMAASVLMWLTNNAIYLFKEHFMAAMLGGSICRVFVYLVSAGFVSTAFGLISALTMLGFSTVQYIAVCKPLHHTAILRRSRVLVFLVCCWVATLLAALIPFIILMMMTSSGVCGAKTLTMISDFLVIGTKACTCFVSVIYCITIALCVRIYVEIRVLGARMMQCRHERNVNTEKRAFITMLILLVTLMLTFLPYTILFIYSLDHSDSSVESNRALIFYMSLLPYCKFSSDPVLYGIRMRGLGIVCHRLGVACGCASCACVRDDRRTRPPSSVMQTATYTLHNPSMSQNTSINL